MERLPRFAIYLAIGIGISFFAIFMYAILPHLIENVTHEWEQILNESAAGKNREQLLELFREHPAYIIFMEKYPEAGENFRDRGNGNGRMELTAMNFTSYNMMMLELNYDKRDDNLYVEATCENKAKDKHLRIRGNYSVNFIEQTDCLDQGIPSSPPIPEPTYEEPWPLACGDGAVLQDGVCVIHK